ncbi:MAG: nitroreductase family protein, partial [Candidatus Bathyarchaeia archaeon]
AHGGLEGYLIQDCSAAIENILLAATALGLGACWLGVYPREDRVQGLKKLFRLPESVIPIGVIAVGKTKITPPPRTRYNDAKVHWNQW